MVDLKTHNEHWLRPDGRVLTRRLEIGHHTGTVEVFPNQPTQDAELVSFQADYIFCTRRMSEETKARLRSIVEAETGAPFIQSRHYDIWHCGRHYDGYGDQVLWGMWRAEEEAATEEAA